MQQRKMQGNGTEKERGKARGAEQFLWQFGFEPSSYLQGYASLYARGDSMQPRILAGDLVFIQLGTEVRSGEYEAEQNFSAFCAKKEGFCSARKTVHFPCAFFRPLKCRGCASSAG